MDIVKRVLRDCARAVTLGRLEVVLLHGHGGAGDLGNPGDMARGSSARGSSIALRDTPSDGLVVNTNARPACGVVPGIRIAPIGALVLVGEVDAEAFVDAPGDEAGALALEVVPLVDGAAVALVRIVVGHRAWDLTATRGRHAARALGLHVSIAARVDVVVGDVAAVRGLVPDAGPTDVGSGGLAGNRDTLALLVGLHHRKVRAGARAAVDGIASNRVRKGIRQEECQRTSSKVS